ncbi:hypothetical protein NG800_004095 [Epilithonimonas ginsengisoli]|uniref:Energy transducer TonB n=1 Tax=Epilithonimonas ginsengisoli TaxID=1245592 RepID=A0ABU4JEH9_9FLAO|nr:MULTISPECIES: hypothetical protein [Chryseobacterium group]MBV6879442.1 hypothetical protein [Epilithonimonas sp. FP105]MDW8548078.1 hypothetical protein [Epilithonimonas ginsengisoli]OAH64481.1 hypothetical protein AXA65_19180 [Chryseobacterium sp. FP211-J200]
MEFRRRTKKLSGLPIAFYVVALLFFVLLFSFNSLYYKASEQPKPIVAEVPKPVEAEPEKDSVVKPEIYLPDIEVLPADTVSIAKGAIPVKEEKKEPSKSETEDKKLAKKDDSSTPLRSQDPKDDKITKIGKDRILTAFIPGTMGKAGKLPSHNCKTKGQLVMFITVDKAGNVTSAGRSSGIKDACNVTAAVIWTKKYVKAKKSQNVSQGTYTIVF